MKKFIAVCFALVVMFMEASTALASPLGEHLHSKFTSNVDSLAAFAISLIDAPEPGSLFILGGVLLVLALFVAGKAAKSTKQF